MLTCCMVVFRYSDIEEIVLKIMGQFQIYINSWNNSDLDIFVLKYMSFVSLCDTYFSNR